MEFIFHPVVLQGDFLFLREEIMKEITLKGGEIREFENGISVADIAKGNFNGLVRENACSCRINGEVKDLRTVVDRRLHA